MMRRTWSISVDDRRRRLGSRAFVTIYAVLGRWLKRIAELATAYSPAVSNMPCRRECHRNLKIESSGARS